MKTCKKYPEDYQAWSFTALKITFSIKIMKNMWRQVATYTVQNTKTYKAFRNRKIQYIIRGGL